MQSVGLGDFEKMLLAMGAGVESAAAHALNDTAVSARKLGSQEIRKNLALSAGYIDSRLLVSRRATVKSLEAVIIGRDRPTSLARFSRGAPRFGRQRTPVRVKVSAAGGSSTMRKAFFMRLRRGSAAVTAENSNVGLAIRLTPGERVENKNEMAPLGGGIYLLYGPSVAQVYRTASVETLDDIGAQLQARFSHYLLRGLPRG